MIIIFVVLSGMNGIFSVVSLHRGQVQKQVVSNHVSFDRVRLVFRSIKTVQYLLRRNLENLGFISASCSFNCKKTTDTDIQI